MRLLIISLVACLFFATQLFAQEKKDEKTATNSRKSANIDYQRVQSPDVGETLDPYQIKGSYVQDVGYGFQKRSDVTGSISSVNISSEKTASYSNLAEYLIGRVSGVMVMKDSNNPYGYKVQIRGVNSINFQGQPLFVIDGMPVNAGFALEMVNPQDIASVDVIKDGTAAIYGSRGANGVILINTKH